MILDTAFLALPAKNLEESCAFYQDVLGLLRKGESTHGIRSVDFSTNSLILRIYEWTEEFNRGGHTGLQLHVEAIDESQRKLANLGIEVTDVRKEPWGGTVCTFSDPDGNRIDLLQKETGKTEDKAQD